MDKEREKLHIESHPIGERGRIILVIYREGKNPILLIPKEVEVRQRHDSGELGEPLGIDFQKAPKGEYLVEDDKRGKKIVIKLDSDKGSLGKVA